MNRTGIAIFTAVEVVTLAVWLLFAGMPVGAAVLVGGLFLEHVLASNVKSGRPITTLGGVPYSKIAVNAVLEAAIWVVWLLLWPHYQFSLFGVGIPAVAIAFLLVALTVEHSVTDNIFHGLPIFGALFKPQVIGFSIVEAAGATAWKALIGAGLGPVGLAALAVASFVEHTMAIRVAQQPAGGRQ